MGRVVVTQQLNAQYVYTDIARGNGLRRAVLARGIATQTQAKRRIREAPRRIDTGNLINSIQIREYFDGPAPVVRVGTDVEYALYVHDGTQYMQANPYLTDGLKRAIAQFTG